MLFLLRLTFWILVICLLLPGSREDNRRLMTSAERTVSDVRGFCQRNPDVCEDARITMTSMLSRLKNGAEVVQTWLAEDSAKSGANGEPSPSAAPAQSQPPANGAPQQLRLVPRWQDSLNPADKQLPWRGPARL
ncbi:MAG: DUF5330 domain-containing protein [Rhodomicrobium sp.]